MRDEMKRDLQLDMYRALVMIYILCVIHTSYWLGLCPEPYKSLILFEMPVVFFISGAAVGLSDNGRGFTAVVKNRFRRVMLPYYFYIACCLLFILLLGLACDILPAAARFKSLCPSLEGVSPADILIPRNDSLRLPYMWHLWFIVPYMIVSCLFPLQRWIAYRVSKILYAVIIFFLCMVAQISGNHLFQNVAVYNFFFMAGFLFYKKLSVRNITIIMIVSAFALAVSWAAGIPMCPMQGHKFPPDIFFLLFGITAICLLGIVFSFVRIPSSRLLGRWNRHGYTVYLWQNLFFVMALILLPKEIFISGSWRPAGNVLYPVVIFLIATLAGFILPRLEEKVLGLIRIPSGFAGFLKMLFKKKSSS